MNPPILLSSDQDSDTFSFCDDYDPQYFDCLDTNANVNPSRTEICNALDDNCDGFVDNNLIGALLSLQVPFGL